MFFKAAKISLAAFLDLTVFPRAIPNVSETFFTSYVRGCRYNHIQIYKLSSTYPVLHNINYGTFNKFF